MSDTIQERLRAIARQRAEDRVVAEFGPGGGNPNAVPQDHIEWEAADEIDRLRAELAEANSAKKILGESNYDLCEKIIKKDKLIAELEDRSVLDWQVSDD